MDPKEAAPRMQTGRNNDRTALTAGLWYVLSSVLIRLTSFLTTPLFTRLLTTAQYGAAGTFQSCCSLLLPVFSLNLMNSIGRAKLDYPEKLDEYIGSVRTLSLLVSLGLSLAGAVFLRPLSSLLSLRPEETVLLLVYLCFAPAVTFAQAGLRYRYRTRENILMQWYLALAPALLSLLLILFAGWDRGFSRMVGLTVPTFVLSLLIFLTARPGRRAVFDREYWRYGLELSVPMMLHALSLNILAQSDKLVIARFSGQTEVAYFHLVRNYALLLYLLLETVNQAWLPWFHDSLQEGRREEIRRYVRLLAAGTCVLGLCLTAAGPEAVLLLGGSAYEAAAPAVPATALGIICQCLYAHYINLELHMKKTGYASFGTMAAAALNLALNFLFVPKYGFAAAAATTFLSYLMLLLLHFLIVRKKLGVRLYDDRFLLLSAAVSAGFGGLLYLAYPYLPIRLAAAAALIALFVTVFRKDLSAAVRLLRPGAENR